MKILSAHNYYQASGGEDVVFSAERELLERYGHCVSTLTLNNRQLVGMSGLDMLRHTLWSPHGYALVREKIRAERPDLVHFHNIFPLLSPAAYQAAQELGVPVVQTLHNYRLICPNALLYRDQQPCEDCVGRPFPWPGVVHRCYRHSYAASLAVAGMLGLHRLRGTWKNQVNAYIALTEFSRQRLVAGGLPAERIFVKPNFSATDPGPGLGQGDFFLFAGRLSPEKGVQTLLAAWQLLKSPARLQVAGDGPLAPLVQQAAAANPQIEWLGQQAPLAVLQKMQAATALVMPSTCYEGLPLVIVEALACGLPVIASQVGGLPDLVLNGKTGLLFPPGQPAELAARIDWLLANPLAQAPMRQAARQEYLQKYTPETNYQQLIEIYQQVIKENSRSIPA